MRDSLSWGNLFSSVHRTIFIFTIFSFIMVLLISPALAHHRSNIVFGPKQYTRTTGQPNHFKDTFQAQQGKGKIFIKNGDKLFRYHHNNRNNHNVDGATISFNGKKIFNPHDFKHHRNFLIANVNLKNGQNTIEVELRSKPGSQLTIEIIQTGITPQPKPTVTLSANPANIASGAEATLTWTSANADTCIIDNGVGEVSLNGSLSVNPTKTTTYTIKATGPGGAASAIVTVTIVSRIDIIITSPLDGASLTGSSTMVTGTVNNSNGTETGVTVNGIPASLSNNQFTVNNVPLTIGPNTIKVTATDINGTTATKTITVNRATATNYIKLRAYPDSGISPLEVTLRINGSFSISNPSITFTGPGAVEQLTGTNPDEYKYKITTEGVYYFTVQAIGPDNNTYQDTMAITVLSLAQIDALLRAKWAIFTSALTNRDTSTALKAMYPASRESYQTMFNLLKDQLPAIVSTHTGLVLQSIIENRARYELGTMEDGVAFTYRVSFIKDANGLWVIREF